MDVSCLARLCMTECSLEISWNCPLWRLLKKKILLASTERFKQKDVTYLYSSTICIFINMFFLFIPSYGRLKLHHISPWSFWDLKYVCMDSFVFSISNTLQLRNHLLHTVLDHLITLQGWFLILKRNFPKHVIFKHPCPRKEKIGSGMFWGRFRVGAIFRKHQDCAPSHQSWEVQSFNWYQTSK